MIVPRSSKFKSTISCFVFVAFLSILGCGQPQIDNVPLDQPLLQLEQSANRGDTSAQLRLGKIYRDGHLVAQNYETAAKWYRKAAEAGNAEAERLWGLCHISGTGVEPSISDAVVWLLRSSNHGDAAAQFYLGLLFESKNMENEAIVQWANAAKNGHTASQTMIGMILLESDEWEEQREGIAWLRKAAENNDPTAQWRLGKYLEEGIDVSRNADEAVRLYRKSAEQGNRDARDRLVRMGVEDVPFGDYLTCATLGFPAKIPIPAGYQPADSVVQASVEIESSVLGDNILLPVLYGTNKPFLSLANPPSIRIIYSPGKKASVCPDDKTWEHARQSYIDSIEKTPPTLTLSSSISASTDGVSLPQLSGPGWAGRFAVMSIRTDNPLDVFKGGLMFWGVARIGDRIVAVSFFEPTGSSVDLPPQFQKKVQDFLSRLYTLNKQP